VSFIDFNQPGRDTFAGGDDRGVHHSSPKQAHGRGGFSSPYRGGMGHHQGQGDGPEQPRRGGPRVGRAGSGRLPMSPPQENATSHTHRRDVSYDEIRKQNAAAYEAELQVSVIVIYSLLKHFPCLELERV